MSNPEIAKVLTILSEQLLHHGQCKLPHIPLTHPLVSYLIMLSEKKKSVCISKTSDSTYKPIWLTTLHILYQSYCVLGKILLQANISQYRPHKISSIETLQKKMVQKKTIYFKHLLSIREFIATFQIPQKVHSNLLSCINIFNACLGQSMNMHELSEFASDSDDKKRILEAEERALSKFEKKNT